MKKFSTSISGYNKNEVNAFVSDVTKEYESMLNKLKLQDKEISELKEKIVRYQNMESTLNKAIMLAEESGSQIKRMARDEGRGIIEDAKRNASRIVNDALIKAQKLENDGENLRQRISLFKRRFQTILETELEVVKNIDEDM